MESLANDINRNVVVLVYAAEPPSGPSCSLPNSRWPPASSKLTRQLGALLADTPSSIISLKAYKLILALIYYVLLLLGHYRGFRLFASRQHWIKVVQVFLDFGDVRRWYLLPKNVVLAQISEPGVG